MSLALRGPDFGVMHRLLRWYVFTRSQLVWDIQTPLFWVNVNLPIHIVVYLLETLADEITWGKLTPEHTQCNLRPFVEIPLYFCPTQIYVGWFQHEYDYSCCISKPIGISCLNQASSLKHTQVINTHKWPGRSTLYRPTSWEIIYRDSFDCALYMLWIRCLSSTIKRKIKRLNACSKRYSGKNNVFTSMLYNDK